MNLDFSMGEYGAYVWTCFALFGAMLAWDLLMPLLRARRLRRELALRARRQAARTATTAENPVP